MVSSKTEQLAWKIIENAGDGVLMIELASSRVLVANPAACAMHGYDSNEFVGLDTSAFIHPDSQQVFGKCLQAFRSGRGFDTRVLHVRRDGVPFFGEWHGTRFAYQGKACLLGVVRDVSRRVQAEQRLQQRIEARTREQSTLLDISHTLASTLDLQPRLVLEQLRGIIRYTHAGLFGLADATLTALAVQGSHKFENAAPFQIRLNGPEALMALFNGHQPIRIADIRSPDPEAVFLRLLLSGDAAVLLEGVRSWMWVPLAVKGRIIGGLGVAQARRNYFTAHQAALALSMADQVAITMANAELYERARTLAALQERQRLAQNLHDAVNQSLFSAGLIAEVLPRLWERDPVEARKSLEDLRMLTRGALAEMRALLAELRPSVLTDSSLGDLLRQLANAFSGRTNIPVNLKITGEHILPAELQVALYRICQETLNNIAKHAGASQVEIDLRYDPGPVAGATWNQATLPVIDPGELQRNEIGSVEMHIGDNGRGFEPGESILPGHYGLGMMRERAEEVGAQLTVDSQPDHGTEVTVRWPGNREQEAI